MTYEEALTELQKIAENLENETVSIDNLTQNVQRANHLIQFCKEKLRNVETEIKL
jgi:exodeoxyribonuclease VII small subunit